ncbi:MAG: UDP-N-acetylmuramoyl-L-alanyl-D-glutamate--2,6-diaminopimelate ligase [Hyphococcus sp.]|nr:MAG: UDP-N-acetylmuramoyl-L-alanyl-D-glutamate--2,6-diaminopimelate ligase [Marinicaulis sp.]
MRLSELAGEALAPDPVITGLTADSRAVEAGFLFAALPGSIVDGAKYVPQAEKNGAAAVLANGDIKTDLPLIKDENPRKRLSEMAARFYPGQPRLIAGITGTNGKTSTALFTAQLWDRLGENAASMGTLGAQGKSFKASLGFTTPEPVMLHKTLDQMAEAGVTHLVMEVSSHGLAQHRADGVTFSIAAFTNITQDHLDFHNDFDDYRNAKLRLFKNLLSSGGVAVIHADGDQSKAFSNAALENDIAVFSAGENGEDLKLLSRRAHATGIAVKIEASGEIYDLELPLVGGFQVENALVAAGIVIASGHDASVVLPLLRTLAPIPGRMQRVGAVAEIGVYVDYAHTPDAISTALQAIRPHASGRVIAIIGAGGDRDRSKRSLMGAAAHDHADIVIVTDDNPRSEDPAIIRAQVMKGCPDAKEIGDRGEAIAAGVAMLGKGDVLLIMGKGHETGQQVGDKILPFDDVDVASRKLGERYRELGK